MQEVSEDYHHIIIDNASIDGSKEIAEFYIANREHARLISEKDSGIYNAMNKGLALSKPGYISFLNSGDVLANNKCLQKILTILKSEADIDLLYSDVAFVDKNRSVNRVWKSGQFSRWKLFWGWMPPHPLTFIATELVARHRGFNENFKIAADYDLMLRILMEPGRKIRYLKMFTIKMESGGISNGSLYGIFRSNIEVIKSWIGLKGFFAPYWILITKPLSKVFQLKKGIKF